MAGAIIGGVALYETRARTAMELTDLAADIDRASFGGRFTQTGATYQQIAAMWLTESSGNPRATNFMGGDGAQGGSWGLGQVTARTAGDYGIIAPLAPLMLLPRIGGRVSMQHVEFTIGALRRAGRAGSASEWIQAYNVGVTGYLNNARNTAHLNRFNTNLASI